jgi:hypothetical protein
METDRRGSSFRDSKGTRRAVWVVLSLLVVGIGAWCFQHRPEPDPYADDSAHLQLSSTRMSAGSQVEGSVVIVNDTGEEIEVPGCLTPFRVALGNEDHSTIAFSPACMQTFTLPVGRSTWPVLLRATETLCNDGDAIPASGPACQQLPLPAGVYQATVNGAPAGFVPAPVSVTVT